MYGYTFEVTNKKTGDTYIGKRYAVSFDKNYFGEENNNALALAIEKYGRPMFEVKMLMPFESKEALDEVFSAMNQKPVKKVVIKETPDVAKDDEMHKVEVKEEPEEKPVRKRKSKKAEA